MQDSDTGTYENFTLVMGYYDSYKSNSSQVSGVYIFRPTSNTPTKFNITGNDTFAENNQLKFYYSDN